jgi:Asp/Glu/hydantoin racemase
MDGMIVKSITPIRVSAAELARRQARYDELSPPHLTIELVNLADGDDVPRRLESATDIARSDRLVAEEIARTDPARHDAVLPDCVLDPGVVTTAGSAPLPVYGIAQLASGFLAALGRRFAAVARNRPIAAELDACLRRYTPDAFVDDVIVLDLGFEDIEDEATWNASIDAVVEGLGTRGVAAVINGCSAVDVRPRGGGPAVVDPTRLALQVLGLAAATGVVAASPDRER